MRRLRGAIIGCGMVCEHHLRAWARIPDVEIALLVDRDLDRAEARRREFAPDARTAVDLHAGLALAAVDFADVLTPPSAHRDVCLAAIDAGLHVICQKPLAATLEEAREIAAAAARRRGLFAVHDNHRYRPWFREILRRRDAGFFGAISLARFEQHDATAPAEAYKLDGPRGVLLEYGTHLVDMARALLGEPRGVVARCERVHPRVRGESQARATLDFGAARAEIDVAWLDGGAEHGGVAVEGERGLAIYEGTMTRGESARFRLIDKAAGGAVVLDERRSPLDDYAASFRSLQEDAARAMREGVPRAPAAEEALRTLEWTLAAYAAAAAPGESRDLSGSAGL